MNKIIQSGALLLALLISNITWAGSLSENSLSQLMALSGLNKQAAQIPGLIQAGAAQARQQGAAIPDAEFVEVQKSIGSAYSPSDFLSTLGDEIKKNVSEEDAKDLLIWYKSSLGKKITKAEERASTPAAYQEMMKQAQSLLADKKRLMLAKEIDSLIDVSGMTMNIQESSGVAVYTAISSAMNPGKPVNIKPYMDQVAAQKQQMNANIKQLVLVSFIYGYKNIKIANIKKYISFLKKPSTKRLNDSAIKGMVNAFNQSTNRMAKSLAVTFKKHAEKKNKK